tara:strand:+ start:550 stop:651 length:102 start_codon:yes stop_codon:yes gene_type:complete
MSSNVWEVIELFETIEMPKQLINEGVKLETLAG